MFVCVSEVLCIIALCHVAHKKFYFLWFLESTVSSVFRRLLELYFQRMKLSICDVVKGQKNQWVEVKAPDRVGKQAHRKTRL